MGLRASAWEHERVSKTAEKSARALVARFGERVRERRVELRLSQQELAELADVSVGMISLVERGKRSPSFEVMASLSAALKRPVAYFFAADVELPQAPEALLDEARRLMGQLAERIERPEARLGKAAVKTRKKSEAG